MYLQTNIYSCFDYLETKRKLKIVFSINMKMEKNIVLIQLLIRTAQVVNLFNTENTMYISHVKILKTSYQIK